MTAESEAPAIGRECRGVVYLPGRRKCQLPLLSGEPKGEHVYAVLIRDSKPLTVWEPGEAAEARRPPLRSQAPAISASLRPVLQWREPGKTPASGSGRSRTKAMYRPSGDHAGLLSGAGLLVTGPRVRYQSA